MDPDSWNHMSSITHDCFRSQNLEALPVWREIWAIFISQEFKILVLAEGAEHEAVTLDGIIKGLRFHSIVPPGKENVVANALSCKPRKLIMATLMIKEWQALETLAEFDLQGNQPSRRRHFGCLIVQSHSSISIKSSTNKGWTKVFVSGSTK